MKELKQYAIVRFQTIFFSYDYADIDNLEELNRPNAQEDEIDLEIVSGKKYIF